MELRRSTCTEFERLKPSKDESFVYKLGRMAGVGVMAFLILGAKTLLVGSQVVPPVDAPPPVPGPLKNVTVPLPPNLNEFIAITNGKPAIQAAIILGKALFWDQNAGNDGLACASCHFQAGADNRVKNQLSPGLRNTNSALSQIFNLTASNNKNMVGPPPGGGPNYKLKRADFPFHQLSDPSDANSAVQADTDDVASSQGVYRRDVVVPGEDGEEHHVSDSHGSKKDQACSTPVSFFSVHGLNVRQVEPRNTPTMINAIFFYRNFWDGRANNMFNGVNVWGPRDPTAGSDPANSIMVPDASGKLVPFKVSLRNASLASQAVGPPTSDLEMACRGRIFQEIAERLLPMKALKDQDVDRTDSVLGPNASGKGLRDTYATLITRAFNPRFWDSPSLTDRGESQMVKNFSLFWGLSIMLYESTLVSDDTPFDRYRSGGTSVLNDPQSNESKGKELFFGRANCVACHKGSEFSGATVSEFSQPDESQVEHMIMGQDAVAFYDSGFYNIGVRPTFEDIGVGGLDPFGHSLSWSRQAKEASAGTGTEIHGIQPDGFDVFTCKFQVDPCMPIAPDSRDAVDGSFKTPSLRNVELTGPYFHNGGFSTLEQVVDFYNRGGNARSMDGGNTTGFGPNPTNKAPNIKSLQLSDNEKQYLVAFLKTLTDDRVRWERAPFDHPALDIPDGHPDDENSVKPKSNLNFARDTIRSIPAVGATGRDPKKSGPLQPFDAGLQ